MIAPSDTNALGWTVDEHRTKVDGITESSDAEAKIKGTGGARKIRFTGRGK
ncbi:hypothetical protein HGB07_10070 [Candidatus Roizmanbacteria bacterium]|nr:hypothetical protein [Candidatus Roizmanbacteria bacterium]